MDQWCQTDFLPDFTNHTNSIDVEYYNVPTAPTQMPGQYMNGDILVVVLKDGTLAPVSNVLANWKSGEGGVVLGSAGIYTWDSTSAKRGVGGNPTTLCQGTAH